MEKYSVFKIIEDSLYSMRYCNEKSDKFYELFDNWTDIEYLYLFFKKHESDLKSGFFNKKKVKNAVNRTKKDAKKLENKLIKIAKEGKIDNYNSLQTIFKPLYNKDRNKFPIPDYQYNKIYGIEYKSWLRVYAIRLDSNLFVITGGAIKLTKTMNDRNHLKEELEKLERTKSFLEKECVIDSGDLEILL